MVLYLQPAFAAHHPGCSLASRYHLPSYLNRHGAAPVPVLVPAAIPTAAVFDAALPAPASPLDVAAEAALATGVAVAVALAAAAAGTSPPIAAPGTAASAIAAATDTGVAWLFSCKLLHTPVVSRQSLESLLMEMLPPGTLRTCKEDQVPTGIFN